MISISRRRLTLVFLAVLVILVLYQPFARRPRRGGHDGFHNPGSLPQQDREELQRPEQRLPKGSDGKFHWSTVKLRHPIPPRSMRKVPKPKPGKIPQIQASFDTEPEAMKRVRLQRMEAVRGNFSHAWNGYRAKAWLSDEVRPLSGGKSDPFGGWAMTLVDSLGMRGTDTTQWDQSLMLSRHVMDHGSQRRVRRRDQGHRRN